MNCGEVAECAGEHKRLYDSATYSSYSNRVQFNTTIHASWRHDKFRAEAGALVMASDADILVPQLRFGGDEVAHELNTFGVVEDS